MQQKIKLKDIIVVFDDSNSIRFGILNNQKDKFKFLRTGEIYPVSHGLKTFVWQRDFVDLYNEFYYYEVDAGHKIMACPLVFGRKDFEASSENYKFSFNEIPQVLRLGMYFLEQCPKKETKFNHIFNILIGCNPFKEIKDDGFTNDNRNKPIDLDMALKIESAVNCETAQKNMAKKNETSKEDEEICQATKNF